jgi:hypothetical protein
VAEDLHRFLRDEPIHARRATPLKRLGRWASHHRGVSTPLGVITLLLPAATLGSSPAAGCADNTMRLVDVATREQVAELHGHTDYIHAVAWSPDGTLNDPSDADRSWTVELAFPWKELGKKAEVPIPPKDGEQWRVNFSRVEWKHEIADGKYRKIKGPREDNWVWSPQYAINMHRPETWGYVQFSTALAGTASIAPDPTGHARFLLHRILYAQAAFEREHARWARNLTELGLEKLALALGVEEPRLEGKGDRLTITTRINLPRDKVVILILHQDSRMERHESASRR